MHAIRNFEPIVRSLAEVGEGERARELGLPGVWFSGSREKQAGGSRDGWLK